MEGLRREDWVVRRRDWTEGLAGQVEGQGSRNGRLGGGSVREEGKTNRGAAWVEALEGLCGGTGCWDEVLCWRREWGGGTALAERLAGRRG